MQILSQRMLLTFGRCSGRCCGIMEEGVEDNETRYLHLNELCLAFHQEILEQYPIILCKLIPMSGYKSLVLCNEHRRTAAPFCEVLKSGIVFLFVYTIAGYSVSHYRFKNIPVLNKHLTKSYK